MISDNYPVAYASNDTNSTTDLQRGSLSQTEGGETDDGYQFVWEFTASQGNGTIAAVALTSAMGGAAVYGSAADSESTFFYLNSLRSSASTGMRFMLLSAVEMDFENEVIYTMRFVNSSIYLYKVNYPIFSVGLTDSINEETLELPTVTVIATSTFAAVSTYYYCFLDGHNGYWYGFANKANSSGDAELLWVKISKEDYSITEGSWTLSNVTMTYTGYRTGYTVTNQYIRNKSIIRNGYLYVMSYDCTGIYKINLDDSADVTLIDLGFTSEDLNMNGSSTAYGGQWYYLIEDVIIAYDFIILADDTIIQTAGASKFTYSGSPMFIYKNFFVHWGGYGSYVTRYVGVVMPYLATICNLDTAMVKTADSTMRITYTLTETS